MEIKGSLKCSQEPAKGLCTESEIQPTLSNHIVTYLGLAWLIIMGSGFDDWICWHFFTITLNYNSSHIELLNDVCLTNLYEEFLKNLSRMKFGPN
jgi:hypothetical protein